MREGGGGGDGEWSPSLNESCCCSFKFRFFELESLAFGLDFPSFEVDSLSSALKVLVSLVLLKTGGGDVRVEVLPFPGLNASGTMGGSRRGAWEDLGGRAGGAPCWLRGGGGAMALVSSENRSV